MSRDEIYARLNQIFRDMFSDDSIVLTPNTTASDIEEWDSVSHITIIVAVEVEFGVKFKTGEVESLKNIGEMVAIIERKLGVHETMGAERAAR